MSAWRLLFFRHESKNGLSFTSPWLTGLLLLFLLSPFALIGRATAEEAGPMLLSYSALLLALRAGLLIGLALGAAGDKRLSAWVAGIGCGPVVAAVIALLLPLTTGIGLLAMGHGSSLLIEYQLQKTGIVPAWLVRLLILVTVALVLLLAAYEIFGPGGGGTT